MGKINKGILGGFSGKVGNVVGGSWKGIDWMRSEPQVYNNPKTEKQQAQRSKFGVCSDFARGALPAINIGLKSQAVKKTAFNVLISNLCKYYWDNANNKIDYEAVKLSAGSLSGADSFGVSVTTLDNKDYFGFEWSSPSGARENDLVCGCVYHPADENWLFSLCDPTFARADEFLGIPIPDGYALEECYFYLFFVSPINGECSPTSMYTEYV